MNSRFESCAIRGTPEIPIVFFRTGPCDRGAQPGQQCGAQRLEQLARTALPNPGAPPRVHLSRLMAELDQGRRLANRTRPPSRRRIHMPLALAQMTLTVTTPNWVATL